MTKAEEKFKQTVRDLHKEGIYPGPTILNERLHGHRSNSINGRETRWRREIMKELGIKMQRPWAEESFYDSDAEFLYG